MCLNPRLKSNISSTSISYSNLLSNIKNNSKIFFLIFLYFYWHLFHAICIFLCYLLYEGLLICFHLDLWFWVEGAPTGTLAPPDNLAAWWSRFLLVVTVLWVSEVLCIIYFEVGLFWSIQWLGNPVEYIDSGDLAEFEGDGSKRICVSLWDWHESRIW